MTFLADNREQILVNAFLANQTKVEINRVEIFLTPLKKDTYKNREKEAEKKAQEIINILN